MLCATNVKQIERLYASNLPLSADMARSLQSFGGSGKAMVPQKTKALRVGARTSML